MRNVVVQAKPRHFTIPKAELTMVDDHIFDPPGARRPPPPKKWGQSKAKQLLQRDLATGSIPLSGHLMNARQVYDSRPEYAMFPFDLFPRRLSALRTEAKAQNNRRNLDSQAYAHDRQLFPHPTHSTNGTPRWEGSEAERLLKLDITADLYPQHTPQEMYQSRRQYQDFSLEVFRGHIHQEIKRRKFVKSFYGNT